MLGCFVFNLGLKRNHTNPSRCFRVADLLRFPAILSRLLPSAVLSSMGGFGRHTLLFLLRLNTATGTEANRNPAAISICNAYVPE